MRQIDRDCVSSTETGNGTYSNLDRRTRSALLVMDNIRSDIILSSLADHGGVVLKGDLPLRRQSHQKSQNGLPTMARAI